MSGTFAKYSGGKGRRINVTKLDTERVSFPYFDQDGKYHTDEKMSVTSKELINYSFKENTLKIYVKKPFVSVEFTEISHDETLKPFSCLTLRNVGENSVQRFEVGDSVVEVLIE